MGAGAAKTEAMKGRANKMEVNRIVIEWYRSSGGSLSEVLKVKGRKL
jgi:hypothetical protein